MYCVSIKPVDLSLVGGKCSCIALCIIGDVYEMKTKVPIWALLKGSYVVPENRDGRVVKPIHALKHAHQRMMRNSLL